MTYALNRIYHYPADFRQEVFGQLLKIISRGECLQVSGLPGSGKSSWLSMLALYPKILEFHLKEKADLYRFVYLDLNLIPERTTAAILNFILSQLKETDEEITQENLIAKELEKTIKNMLSDLSKKLILIFDPLTNLAEPSLFPLFNILKGFRDQNIFSLSYIFAVNRPIITHEEIAPFGKLGSLVVENIYYLPPLSRKDAFLIIGQHEERLNLKISESEKEKIFSLSGGNIQTAKRLCQAIANDFSIEEISQNPLCDLQLITHLERIWEALAPEKETLRNLINHQISEAGHRLVPGENDKENLKTLRNFCLIDQDNQPVHPLFFTFAKQKLAKETQGEMSAEKTLLMDQLTGNEYKALKFLLEHQGQICQREDLSQVIWGKDASLEITNHAVDQLLHRLRKKLSLAQSPLILKTIRGRGHRLSAGNNTNL